MGQSLHKRVKHTDIQPKYLKRTDYLEDPSSIEVFSLMSLRETFVYTGPPAVFNELQDKQIVFSCRQIHQYNVVFEGSYKQFVYLLT